MDKPNSAGGHYGQKLIMKEGFKRITVFCGSGSGNNGLFRQHAYELGVALAVRGIELVYGGARVGIMGAVANGTLSAGGKVIGVFPKFLQNLEIAHEGLSELIIVESMHERKTVMNDLCDAVIALPGGYGTLEELFEMLTWAQLGLHSKPVAILNSAGYYNGLVDLVGNMVEIGFLKEINRQMLLVDENIDGLFKKMESYIAPDVTKWLSKDKI